ncbi:MAG: glycosyltransferase family 2 protein [Roseovarius sp.]
MTRGAPKDIAVVIPARNEAERIGACLAAFKGQLARRTTIILVINNTSDATGSIAADVASRCGLDVEILECVLTQDEGVGTARRMGCDHAMGRMPHLRYILTTDADCIVAPNWVARNVGHLQSADAVCGKIDLLEAERGILDGMDQALAATEGHYRTLVQSVYARHVASARGLDRTHGEAAGASLAFRKTAYLAVGGFAQITCGEDRQIVRAMRLADYRVRHVDDVVARASCRLTGRALGGMSDALKARISGADYLVDDCLPGAEWLVTNAENGTLGAWPPLVPDARRLHVRELPQNIEKLETFLGLLKAERARTAPCDWAMYGARVETG